MHGDPEICVRVVERKGKSNADNKSTCDLENVLPAALSLCP